MIDLHCHILPGLDDGSRDLDDSVGMARQAVADGIEVIAATPHIHPSHAVVIGELEERVAQVNAELARQQVAVRVVTGGEVSEPMLDQLDDDDVRRVSLGDGAGSSSSRARGRSAITWSWRSMRSPGAASAASSRTRSATPAATSGSGWRRWSRRER